MKHFRHLLILLLAVISSAVSQLSAQYFENGVYRDWNYTPSAVFGIGKLQNTVQRDYFKISKIDQSSTRIQRYNAAGKLTNTTVVRFVNGRISTIMRSNRWGDTYETTKFTATAANEYLVSRRSSGKNDMLPCKTAKYIYRNNLLAEVRYLDYANNPCNSGNGVAIMRYKRYEDKARYSLLTEIRYFDGAGLPVISGGWDCHRVAYEYDERGNRLSESYYGIDGEAVTDRYGVYKVRSQYNEKDQLVRSEQIGLNEERTRNSYGVSVTGYEYKNGLLARSTRFDEQMKPTRAGAAGDGVAMVGYEYDESGNEIGRYYFDESGNPMNGNNGYHKLSYWYNPQDMLVDEEYFDKYMNPVNDRYRIHRYHYARDNKGRIIEESFFDKNNQPVKDQVDEVYMRKYRYDEQGRVVATSFWQDEYNRMPRWDGYYESVNRYNEEGQITELTYLDEKGNQFKSTSGYSRETRRYNAAARLAERKWFDGNTPAYLANTLVSNFHAVRYNYDDKGRVSSLSYHDAYGNPATARISMEGEEAFECSRIEFVYQGNRLVEESFYKKDNSSPVKVIDCIRKNYVNVNSIGVGYANQ